MIVVSDTSPISNLLTVGQVQLLPAIFQQVYVPQEVWQELSAFHADLDLLKHASWLAVKTVTNQTLMQPPLACPELQIPTVVGTNHRFAPG